jgi:hypothetical protein
LINAIQKAGNDEQLDKVMDGFRDQAVAAHSALQHNEDFGRLLATGQYMRALEQVRRAREPDADAYLDVIRVLQFAAGRRLAIMMF